MGMTRIFDLSYDFGRTGSVCLTTQRWQLVISANNSKNPVAVAPLFFFVHLFLQLGLSFSSQASSRSFFLR